MRYAMLLLALLLLTACGSQKEGEAFLCKYPYGYRAAVVVTFDTEVVREGELQAIAAELSAREINATFFVVAGYFEHEPQVLEPLRSFEVASMAWSQPAWVNASPDERRRQIEAAQRWFVQHGFHPRGFRAPYLLANKEVLSMVKGAGYAYDSSMFYGFEPYYAEGVLEIPVSVNFDAFWDEEKMEYALPVAYMAFQRAYAEGGVFTLLTHVDTASCNLKNFTAFLDYMRRRGVWFPSAGELADWWRVREELELEVSGKKLILRNHAPVAVRGATAVVEASGARGAVRTWRESGKLYVVFPEVPPGGEVSVEVEWDKAF